MDTVKMCFEVEVEIACTPEEVDGILNASQERIEEATTVVLDALTETFESDDLVKVSVSNLKFYSNSKGSI